MRKDELSGTQESIDIGEYYLYPSNIFAHREPHKVTTVLGSCVSVCLFDTVRKMGGINHYMLPLWNGDGLASPRYGNIAIEKLIEKLEHFGCSTRNMKAKVFGGGDVIGITHGMLSIGERNIELARDMLGEIHIPIVAMDVGGRNGRRVVFNTGTGRALMKRLRKQIDDIKP
jgi:chemotaxis protein CheD